MQVIARRKDGVMLVSLGGGSFAAVNVKAARVAYLDALHPEVSNDAVWPSVPMPERATHLNAVRKILDGYPRRVNLQDIGYGLEYDEAVEVQSPSMDARRKALQTALDDTIKRRFGSLGQSSGNMYPSSWWIKDVMDQENPPYVIYCDAEGKHFKWDYNGEMPPQFLGDPVPVEYVPVELRAQYDKHLALAESLADQEHPFAYCLEHIAPKADVDDPKAFCATMVHKATGEWPAEAKKKDDETEDDDED